MFLKESAFLLIILSIKVTIGNNDLTVGLVEYWPNEEIAIGKSLDLIRNKTGNSSLDLLVLPENYGNITVAAPVKIGDNPCKNSTNSDSSALKILSCFANSTKVHLVTNVIEKQDNYLYNTDVIFSDNGTILKKYRKVNVDPEEYGKIRTPNNKDSNTSSEVTFTIKGETFGIFGSNDILFSNPPENLLKRKISKFIFTTGRNWSLGLPFLTASQVQQMWAQSHNVTLYISGQNAGVNIGGRTPLVLGDWSANGIHIYHSSNSSIHYRSLDNENGGDFKPTPTLGLFFDPSGFKSQLLNASKTEEQNATVCYDTKPSKTQFCCQFTVKTNQNTSNVHYQMVAFVGNRTYDRNNQRHFGVEICAVLACLNSSLTSCGGMTQTNRSINFENLAIVANFTKGWKTQYPNSLLDQSFQPIKESQTLWSQKSGGETSFAIKEPINGILTFAIYGRDFGMDYPQIKNESNSSGSSTNPPHKNISLRNRHSVFLMFTVLLSLITCLN